MDAAHVHLHHPNHGIEPLYGFGRQHQHRVIGMPVEHMGFLMGKDSLTRRALQIFFGHDHATHPTERGHRTGMAIERDAVLTALFPQTSPGNKPSHAAELP